MTGICKNKCINDKYQWKQKYDLNNQTYCSICEKMFLKTDNPGRYCKCCGISLRHKSRTKNKRKYKY
jgi:hypothetical protein